MKIVFFSFDLFSKQITKDLFGPSCSDCESNDKSCSVKSNGVNGKDVSTRNGRCQSKCSRIRVNKLIYFKHRDKEKSAQILSEKKLTILREPILKSIGRSVYHNGNHQNKMCCEPKSRNIDQNKMSKDELIEEANPTWFGKSCDQCGNELHANVDANDETIKRQRTTSMSTNKRGSDECRQAAAAAAAVTSDPNNVMIHRIQNWQLTDDSTVDFKSLVTECNNLTLSGHGTAINSELHKTRNFQVLQANQIGNAISASSSDANETQLPNNSVHITHSAASNNAMNCSVSSNNSSTSSNNSSSCSQQARMNSSNCDVTIDELASYIEFQLHLPKPMSSNVYEAMFS